MRTPRLEGSKAKRNRAEAHLESLERLVREFLDGNPYPIVVDSYPEQGRYLIKVTEPKPLPTQDIALLVGDCVHNMRCALDYIAWEFAGADPADRDTMFPLFSDQKTYERRGAWRIKKLPPSAHALIDQMQPYNTPNPKNTALWAIEHLDVADKHKLLTVTVPIARSLIVAFRRGVDGVKARVEYHDPWSLLEHETVIATVSLSPATPQVQVDPKFTPQIAFGDDGEIGRVIAAFARLL